MPQEMIDTFLPQPEEIRRFNKWLFEEFQSYIKVRVLEINSGEDTFSSTLIINNIPVHLSNSRKDDRKRLREKYKNNSLAKLVHDIDPLRPTQDLSLLTGRFSTVLLATGDYPNSLKNEIRAAKEYLRKGGHLIASIRCKVNFFPGASIDPQQLKQSDHKILEELFEDCLIQKIRYFHQPALSEIVVVRKL